MNNNKTKIMLDSCVTFKILHFFKTLKENNFDRESVYQEIKRMKEDCAKIQYNLEKHNQNIFKGTVFEHRTINDIVNLYGEDYNIILNNYKQKLNKKQKLSPEEIKFNEQMKDAFENELLLTQKDADKYKELINFINVGNLFLKMLEGEFEFYIPSVSYEEIISHTKDIKKGWKLFEIEEVDEFTKIYATIVNPLGEKTNDLVEKLAEEYRTPKADSNNQKEMDSKKNALGTFGDSKIMAISSLSGIPLVTINCKDFIFEKSKLKYDAKNSNVGSEKAYKDSITFIKYNENKRSHIAYRNSINPYTTDALAYSLDEIHEGNFKTPSECKLSKTYNLNNPLYKDLNIFLDNSTTNDYQYEL